ncbi:hypothetical protein HAX54_003636 [Datura stramonium]|uniref:Uncharacterized protein n=1 Tax=Datura stramonium TaxID=4076 RepID=A0ABS8T5N1_DATST|nr:hypothetical protein [Datura stramonium]
MLDKSLWINSKGTPRSRKHHCLNPALNGDQVNPPPSMFSNTTSGSSKETKVTTSPPKDLLTIAQMAQAHESSIVKLAKEIPFMIQQAIRKAMPLARDKFEVLENDVISLREDVARHTDLLTSNNMDLSTLAAVETQF